MKLIILEGPDGVGKSTQAKRLCEALAAKLVVQPSGDNCLGFLRPIVKTHKNIEPFARQLLHTCSHIVDAYEDFGAKNKAIVMDRCYASALVYGKMTGLPQEQLDILQEIHHNVYRPLVKKHGYQVHYIQFTAKQPFRQADVKDVYEQASRWKALNEEYLRLFDTLSPVNTLVSDNETHDLIQIDGKTEDQVVQDILKIVA